MKTLTLGLLLFFSGVPMVQPQDNAAIDHARKVRESLIQGKFADVGKGTPAEYQRAAKVADIVIDDIAVWTNRNLP